MFDPENQHDPKISGSLMFDKRRPKVAGDDYGFTTEPDQGGGTKQHPLDSQQAIDIHAKLMGHYSRELERQAENRVEMAIDEDFYDHIQWSEEELAELNARAQAPLVFNLIQTSVNWLLGSQRRATMDYKILPRKKDGQGAADRKSELMRYLRDENRSEYEYSRAFASGVKAGVGWLETGQGNPEDGTIVYDRAESWRNIVWDSLATRPDLSDGRYQFRTKWLDLDIAKALIATGRDGILDHAASEVSYGLDDMDGAGDEPMDSIETAHFDGATQVGGLSGRFDTGRARVRVIEAWFKRIDPKAKVVRGGQFNGQLFDEWSEGHVNDINQGLSTLVSRPREVIWVALLTEGGMLDLRKSPYRHNRFPFTPVWGYRRERDGMPYGIIRGMRDINRDLNKRASKALHLLSSTRVTVEEGAVDDIEELREEAGRPDAVIVHKPGRPAPTFSTDTNLAAAQVDLMSRDAQMIQQISGVTDENLGRKTNATSGKAIIARQDQGSMSTSLFFDNLRFARAVHGEKLICNIEQFFSDQDEFRIIDQRGNPQFVTINDGSAENAIAAFRADFIITEEDWRASARQAQSAELLDLASKLAPVAPQLVLSIMDLIVEAMDVPKRDELVKRIRQITGATDPDADPNNPDEATMAKQQASDEQVRMQVRAMMAEIMEKEAKARKVAAEAAKIEGNVATDQISMLKNAMEAAVAIAGAPAVAAAADQILGQAMMAAAQSVKSPESEQEEAMAAQQADADAMQPPMAADQQPIDQPQPVPEGVMP